MSLGREALFVAGLTLTVGAACSGSNGNSAPAPTTTESPTTLVVEGPVSQYDLAEDAVWVAFQNNDFEAADKLVVKVTDPRIRSLANHAIDAAEAEEASWQEFNANDHDKANRILARVQDAQLAKEAKDAIALDRTTDALWDQTPRDTKAWYEAHTASQKGWYDLHIEAQREWYDIHEQTSEAQTENTQANGQETVDVQPIKDAEAAITPIEPAKFSAFVDYIKHNGKVLKWSEGSRYQIVVSDSGTVFTAELDFGTATPTTPEQLAAATPEFVQIYARLPGEEHAKLAFIDGDLGVYGESNQFVPDGRVNQLFGYDPQLPDNLDFSDTTTLIQNQAAQLRESGAAAQKLYVAAVDATLNS